MTHMNITLRAGQIAYMLKVIETLGYLPIAYLPIAERFGHHNYCNHSIAEKAQQLLEGMSFIVFHAVRDTLDVQACTVIHIFNIVVLR